jgi:hypothetical protein
VIDTSVTTCLATTYRIHIPGALYFLCIKAVQVAYKNMESGNAIHYTAASNLIYKAEKCSFFVLVYLCVCLFVCLYLIQIHISEPIWTKLCTHLPLGLEETVGYVWSENVWTFLPFWPSSPEASAESSARNGCRLESSATALYPWLLLVLVWRHGNDVVADDSFAFLLEVSCTMGNA